MHAPPTQLSFPRSQVLCGLTQLPCYLTLFVRTTKLQYQESLTLVFSYFFLSRGKLNLHNWRMFGSPVGRRATFQLREQPQCYRQCCASRLSALACTARYTQYYPMAVVEPDRLVTAANDSLASLVHACFDGSASSLCGAVSTFRLDYSARPDGSPAISDFGLLK